MITGMNRGECQVCGIDQALKCRNSSEIGDAGVECANECHSASEGAAAEMNGVLSSRGSCARAEIGSGAVTRRAGQRLSRTKDPAK